MKNDGTYLRENPSSKLQVPNKPQLSSSKFQTTSYVWDLEFEICLELDHWNLGFEIKYKSNNMMISI